MCVHSNLYKKKSCYCKMWQHSSVLNKEKLYLDEKILNYLIANLQSAANLILMKLRELFTSYQ